MCIQHIHPAAETPAARTETLSALYRACVHRLYGSKPPHALSRRGSHAPGARQH